MALLRSILSELFGLFIDDGALALLTLALIAVVVSAIKFFGLPPLICGAALLIGYLAILGESIMRYARQRRNKL
ncbi:MAG: hypothetical protein ABI230_08240 [Aestuariivirga sp.]